MTKLVDIEPSSFLEAVEKTVWVNEMVEEHESIVKNIDWEVVPTPTDRPFVGSRWIFKLIRYFKEDLAREFEMKDMVLMHYFLWLEVWKHDGELFVSQGKYGNEILQTFFMESCKPMETHLVTHWMKEGANSSEEVDATIYKKLVGSLMYLVNT
eukprot:PITA_31494